MKLNEIAKQPNPEVERITKELIRLKITSYKLLSDLSVDVNEDVYLPTKYTSIPIQFNRVTGSFYCAYTKITSLKGCPRRVDDTFNVMYTNIATLQDAPQYVGSHFYCANISYLNSLHGVEKWIPNIRVGGEFYCDQTHILGLALIEGITTVRAWHPHFITPGGEGAWVQFDISHHDPFQFQEQLLEHGLTEQAQL